MTSVDERFRRNAAAAAVEPGRAPAARTPLATRRRRPGLVGLALLVVVGGALAGGRLYQTAGAKTLVVVAARDVPAGHRLNRADLATVSIAGPVKAIAGDRLESLVGQTAAVAIVDGTVLNRAMLSTTASADPSQAMIGLALKAGQLPGDGLVPGDTVRLVAVAIATGASPSSASARVLLDNARVYAIRADDTAAGVTVVTLVVDLANAPAVAAAGSAGQVVLIKVGG
jgi:SAF domain